MKDFSLLLTLCNLIFRCYGIGDEYYNNEENSESFSYKSSTNARRTGAGERNKKFLAKFLISDNDYVQEDFIYYDSGRQYKQFTSNISQVNINYGGITTKKFTKSSPDKQKKNISLSILLKEYDYQDEDKDINVLRESADISTSQNSINDNVEIKKEIDEISPFAKFYNLDPAIDQAINNVSDSNTQNRSWYVLHDFPCWNLPILYGEKTNTHNNVFSLYGDVLNYVKDPGDMGKYVYKTVVPPVSGSVNNWCDVEPCYGDHTLCLFMDSSIAQTCNKGYKIMSPTIWDQITIVNTVNSMRNRVANGLSKRYSHLPSASNMNQVIYDYDLEKMSKVWLRQCLPGPAPCSALDNNIVSELECTKFAKHCCRQTVGTVSRCTPRSQCFLFAVVGCIHVWYWRAGKKLVTTDIECGRASVLTFDTVQLLWAKTAKIGCAYGEDINGDIRVICNFAPGAPFFLDTKLYCGIISYAKLRQYDSHDLKITEKDFMYLLGLQWNDISTTLKNTTIAYNVSSHKTPKKSTWGKNTLNKIYSEGWARDIIRDWTNGTKSWIARLVVKYTFIDKSESRCDSDETIYKIGKPGRMCIERGRTYHGLCYHFRDPTPGYRVIAVVAPIILFSLILYDLFSGVVRQTNN